MAPPELDELKKRVGRKLTKRRKEDHHVTIAMPERFRDGDDVDEDVTRPRGHQNLTMNQSVFGMIAAAGSQVDFNARFEGHSSGDDEEESDTQAVPRDSKMAHLAPVTNADAKLPAVSKHRRKLSENKLLRSLPTLGLKSRSPTSKLGAEPLSELSDDKLSKSPIIEVEPAKPAISSPGRGQPIMSQMLEAKAELAQRPSFDLPRTLGNEKGGENVEDSTNNLAVRLKEIFAFEKAEDVISEYPCWLMKSVLLQGFMYITTKHICFYAYLPRNSGEVAKSGYLSKRGQKNPKYNRYWFRLKDDVLSYYTDPSELYFTQGYIDLRYGISATITEKEKNKDGTYFTVVTDQKTYYFKADSVPSAKEWVKSLQKIIFRSHNDGDSVKISLPIANVVDIEEIQVIEFAETCKIRVMEDDESYAIDEYFFSFFSFGKEAINLLKILVEKTEAQELAAQQDLLKPQEALLIPSPRDGLGGRSPMITSHLRPVIAPIRTGSPGPALEDTVKATLSPVSPLLSPSRPSTEFTRLHVDSGRRKSTDFAFAGRKSVDLSRLNDSRRSSRKSSRSPSISRRSLSITRKPLDNKASETQDSSDSFIRASMDEPDSLFAAMMTSGESQGSASQILSGSDALFRPTIPGSDPESVDFASTEKGKRHAQQDKSTPGQIDTNGMANTAGSVPGSEASHATQMSTPTLQSLVKTGILPIQRAAGAFNYLNNNTKRVGSFLATESMGYVGKVSGMWKGGKKHYDGPTGPGIDGEEADEEDVGQEDATKDRFRDHFALPPTETLQATYFGYLQRVLPLYGKIYISDRSFCFRSLLPGTRTKLILPLTDIENVLKEKGFRFGYSGLVVVVKGHSEIFFEFGKSDLRDDCTVTLLQNLESIRYLKAAGLLSAEEQEEKEAAVAEHNALLKARQDGHADHDLALPRSTSVVDASGDSAPIMFDDPRASILNFKPSESLRITCLTIGSRGDVQPYIAIAKGLQAEGHIVKIATHHEFGPWVKSHGIGFAAIEGDPAELMRICVDNGMFTYSFLKEANSTFRGWLDDLLTSAWAACQDSDILIESPSAMCGLHIAEALAIPYFRAFTMPWTRTRAYPHAFAMPEHRMGGTYNFLTYVMFDTVFWKAIAGQINRWRAKELGLGRTNLEKMQPNKVPFLYNFSLSVVVPPLDYSDWIRVTGYWFLDEGVKYEPSKDLTDFIAKARSDGKKLVYIGFGSIVVADSRALTETIVNAVLKADVRCILSKGWSERLNQPDAAAKPEVPLPADLFLIKSVPHDWLFSQVDAVAHHGGAGTTGASLRAGLPTIIKPFFGDQFFFGGRVEDLGVGICLKKLNVTVLSRALWEATHSERIVAKARLLGELIRSENGVETAIQSIYRDLDYARSLIKNRDGKPAIDDATEEIEESWTFIGDDNDAEMIRRIHHEETQPRSGRASIDVSRALSPQRQPRLEVKSGKGLAA